MNEPSVFDGPEISMPPTLLHHDAEGRAYEHRELHNMYAAPASPSPPYLQPPVSSLHSLHPTVSSLQSPAYRLRPQQKASALTLTSPSGTAFS